MAGEADRPRNTTWDPCRWRHGAAVRCVPLVESLAELGSEVDGGQQHGGHPKGGVRMSGSRSRETSGPELSRTNLRSVPRLRTFLAGFRIELDTVLQRDR